MNARLPVSVVLGLMVTLAVLFAMQTLIATAKRELDESGTRHFVDFVRAPRQEATQRKERHAEKPVAPSTPPPTAAPPQSDPVEPATASIEIPVAPVQADIAIEGLGLGGASDGEYLPIVRIAPVYPWRAQAEGIEGFVIVEFTVTGAGTVEDVKVVQSEPGTVFDDAAIEAALKFKYKPRVVNGEPIAVQGVRNRFDFTLES